MKRPEPKFSVGRSMELGIRPLIDECEIYIDELNKESNRGTKHLIFKAAMEVLYGKDVWEWVNEQYE